MWFTLTDTHLLLSSGLMFASVAWMEIAGSLLGEVVQNAVFAATVSWMSNFVFMINGGVYLLAALLTMYVSSRMDFS